MLRLLKRKWKVLPNGMGFRVNYPKEWATLSQSGRNFGGRYITLMGYWLTRCGL